MGAARLSSSAPAAILAGFHRSLMRMPSPDSIDLLSPFLVPPSDARHRLFHGRGKTLPGWEGLTLDRFPPVLVATLFDDYPPATLAALEQRWPGPKKSGQGPHTSAPTRGAQGAWPT